MYTVCFQKALYLGDKWGGGGFFYCFWQWHSCLKPVCKMMKWCNVKLYSHTHAIENTLSHVLLTVKKRHPDTHRLTHIQYTLAWKTVRCTQPSLSTVPSEAAGMHLETCPLGSASFVSAVIACLVSCIQWSLPLFLLTEYKHNIYHSLTVLHMVD